MEFYQWLLRKNEFNVSDTGYFIYCNGDKQQPNFDNKVIFKVSVLEYKGNDKWIEETIFNIKTLLDQNSIPNYSENCSYCVYLQDVEAVT